MDQGQFKKKVKGGLRTTYSASAGSKDKLYPFL